MFIGANVLLPRGYHGDTDRKYPVLYLQGHFPGRRAPLGFSEGSGRGRRGAATYEYWTSDSDEPKKLSVDRFQGCGLCILLVGLRRGHVPHGETLSVTQMEYEAALKADGMDVLVYLLDQEALRRGAA